MNGIVDKVFNVYILNKELLKQVKKLQYFMMHLQRCKNNSDRVKLSLICVLTIEIISKLVIEIQECLI